MARVDRKAKDVYHHGNLRSAILAAATAQVRKEGTAALAIRDIAKRAGVSHAAVYHHFKDRTAVLAGVAEEGFELLARALDAAGESAEHPLERFRRMGLAYVRFASRNPRVYELMFGAEGAVRHAFPRLEAAAKRVFEQLQSTVAECQAARLVAEGDLRAHTLFSWSAVHGISSLMIAGQLRELDELQITPDLLAEMIVSRVFTGLAPQP
jgi:AcrR family transcriptional regulator